MEILKFLKKKRQKTLEKQTISEKEHKQNENNSIPTFPSVSDRRDFSDEELEKFVEFFRPLSAFSSMQEKLEEREKNVLAGIILGDICGSPYELCQDVSSRIDYRTVDLLQKKNRFTDDSVLSVAIYIAAQKCRKNFLKGKDAVKEYAKSMRKYAKQYPDAGYGGHFYRWAIFDEEDERYASYGDGSAMRSGVLGAMFENVENVICHAVYSAVPTHSHPEGIAGAVVTAVLVWMALHGATKEAMKSYILRYYPIPYEESQYFRTVHPAVDISELEEKGKYKTLGVECRIAVPLAFVDFYYSHDYESCIRNGLRYDSDTDTIMAISGGIAASFYHPDKLQNEEIEKILKRKLPAELFSVFWRNVVCISDI